MSAVLGKYILFKHGWDQDDEAAVESEMIEAARNQVFERKFMPAFREFIKREQFIRIMDCLDRDKNIDFNRGFVVGLDTVLHELDRIRSKAEHVAR